jgi:hypothetical protein
MIVPIFGFVHSVFFLVFFLVILACLKQVMEQGTLYLKMLSREFEDRQDDRIHQQIQRERVVEHMRVIRQQHERRV